MTHNWTPSILRRTLTLPCSCAGPLSEAFHIMITFPMLYCDLHILWLSSYYSCYLLLVPIWVGKSVKPCYFKNVKYFKSKIMDDHNLSHSVFGVLDASTDVLGRNILLCADNWAIYLQDTLLQNIKCALSTKLRMMPSTRLGYAWTLSRISTSILVHP
jgi:hypothetical protein